MKNKIIVTGSSGFVGLNLVPYLKEKDYNVFGVSRKPNADEISYDDLTKDIWNKSKAVIHLAGKAHDLKKTSANREYFEVNRDLTIKLFNDFLSSNCEVFIYVSSVKAVKDHIDIPLTEIHEPSPVTVYGISKLHAEEYLLSKKLPKNKRLIILRPCMIHGPNNKGNLNLLFKAVQKSVPYPLGAFNNLRSFVSIDNFCYCIYNLISNSKITGVYNVADDEPISTTSIVEIIGEIIHKKVYILRIPKFIIKFLGFLGDVFRLPLNSERIEKLTENYVVDNTKLKKALKINSFPVSTEEGLRKTIKSF